MICSSLQDIATEGEALCETEVNRMITAVIGGEIEATARSLSAEAKRSAAITSAAHPRNA